MKKCPFCAEQIQDAAIKCRFCGEFLTPQQGEKKEPATAQAMSQVLSNDERAALEKSTIELIQGWKFAHWAP